MSDKKRVVFSFDPQSYKSMEKIKEKAHLGSLADSVRESLRIHRALQNQAEQGYTEVVVRNPKNGEERVLLIPTIEA